MDETQDFTEQLSAGLWKRLRDVILVAERIETYSFSEGDDPRIEPMGPSEARAIATDLVVRALREAGDPDGWRLLARIADQAEGAPIGELAELIDRPRLAAAERINALVQVGLAQRALDTDRAFATVAGDALVAFVRSVAEQLGDQASAFRSEGRLTRDGGAGDGLPLL